MHRSWLFMLALLSPLGCAAQHSTSPEVSSTPSASSPPSTGRRIAYRAEVRLVVERFDEVASQVDALAARFDGFVAHTHLQGAARDRRHGSWTLRVPAARYTAFLQALGELGEIVNLQSSSEDKTTEWVDLDARLRNTRAQEQRLLAVLSDATGKLDEILAVEKELARVRGEIEQMQARQRMLDDLVSLSTVTLVVDEIKDYFPKESATYPTRARRSLEMSSMALVTMLHDLSIIAITAVPWLIAFTLPLALVVIITRALLRRRRVPAQVVT